MNGKLVAEVGCASQTGTEAGNQTPHTPFNRCAWGERHKVFSRWLKHICYTLCHFMFFCVTVEADLDEPVLASNWSRKRVRALRAKLLRCSCCCCYSWGNAFNIVDFTFSEYKGWLNVIWTLSVPLCALLSFLTSHTYSEGYTHRPHVQQVRCLTIFFKGFWRLVLRCIRVKIRFYFDFVLTF